MIYNNGNTTVSINNRTGTREISWEKGDIQLNFPLNIDIKVTNKCAFGYNPKTNKAFCTFCHESARTDGKECNYDLLKNKLDILPVGIELAIGGNEVTTDLISFLEWAKNKGFICSLTVNQGHINRDASKLYYLISMGLIKGLGVSYRHLLSWKMPSDLLKYRNTVFHVIAGIDDINDIKKLSEKGVKKILVLGEKDFGFNKGCVNLHSKCHQEWYSHIDDLFNLFKIVSFDNLAIEQLELKRFFLPKDWELFYQGEHSMYIDAVAQEFAPSSRSKDRVSWDDISLQEYFLKKTCNCW